MLWELFCMYAIHQIKQLKTKKKKKKRLLVVLCFHPELSAGEDQYLILQKLLSMGQQIPHSDPVRSHSLQILTRVIGERKALMIFDEPFLPSPSGGTQLLGLQKQEVKDRVVHIRRC